MDRVTAVGQGSQDKTTINGINMSSGNVTQLKTSHCRHNKWYVDETLAEITCGICEQKLNPIWCLVQQAKTERRLKWRFDELQTLVKKSEDKLRCKCQKCGKMTRIIR